MKSERFSNLAAKTSNFEPPPLYSEGQSSDETKQADAGLDERYLDGVGRPINVGTAFEQGENLNVIRETLYSGTISLFLDWD
jgi:hypothetical protein